MKKTLILLSAMILLSVTGCGAKEDLEATTEVTKDASDIAENWEKATEAEEISTNEADKEQEEIAVQETEEADVKTDTEDMEAAADTTVTEENSKKEENTVAEVSGEKDASNKAAVSDADNSGGTTSAQSEPVQETPAVQEVSAPVSYSPENVVSLATAKVKAGGKLLLSEELDRMLAEGSISKEDYDAYYPYDGTGYYSVFVETDLQQASTTSGRLLGSEDGIAQYIADMLLLETVPSVEIEYAGVYTSNTGSTFYEFRCHR